MKREMLRDKGMEMGKGLWRTAIVRVSITREETFQFFAKGFEDHQKFLLSNLPNGRPCAAIVSIDLKSGEAYVSGLGELAEVSYHHNVGIVLSKIFVGVGSLSKEESARFVREITVDLEKLLADALNSFHLTPSGAIKPRVW